MASWEAMKIKLTGATESRTTECSTNLRGACTEPSGSRSTTRPRRGSPQEQEDTTACGPMGRPTGGVGRDVSGPPRNQSHHAAISFIRVLLETYVRTLGGRAGKTTVDDSRIPLLPSLHPPRNL